jgi:RimJ/RimL family protein N-acetyltransferase
MGDPPVEFVWHDDPVPAGLPITQVYGWLLCPVSGRVLIQEQDDGTFSLPGGTPEPYDADRDATLAREAFEENQVRISAATAYLGYQEVRQPGQPVIAQLRMAGIITEFAARAPDPDNGRLNRRYMTSLATAPAVLSWARDLAGPDGPRLLMTWMYEPSPAMERQLLQRHWRALAHCKPGSWHLPLAVFLAGEPAGMQDLWAEDFAVRRSIASGSWITAARQGRGYGTEARAAILELAFGRLSAAEALTGYIEGNHASERVSRKLGYAPNGQRTVNRDGTGRVTEYQLRLDRPAREASARHDHVSITGLGPCLPMLGLPAPDDPASGPAPAPTPATR